LLFSHVLAFNGSCFFYRGIEDRIMEQGTQNPKTPLPLLFSRIADWSGWEYLYEERRKVSAIIILGICIFLGIGWFISKKQTSSLGMLLQAENVVSTITNPTVKLAPEAIEKDSDKLFNLTSSAAVSSRFCGILAQEDILMHSHELKASFFDTTSKQLDKQGFPLLSQLAQTTLTQGTGSKEEALQKIDSLLPQSRLPWLTLYLLTQKAYLLKELGKPNEEVIEELKNQAKTIKSVEDFFEDWFHLTSSDFFESLIKT
jgi:hypothetical protein